MRWMQLLFQCLKHLLGSSLTGVFSTCISVLLYNELWDSTLCWRDVCYVDNSLYCSVVMWSWTPIIKVGTLTTLHWVTQALYLWPVFHKLYGSLRLHRTELTFAIVSFVPDVTVHIYSTINSRIWTTQLRNISAPARPQLNVRLAFDAERTSS